MNGWSRNKYSRGTDLRESCQVLIANNGECIPIVYTPIYGSQGFFFG